MTDFTWSPARVRAVQPRFAGLRVLDLAILTGGALLVGFIGAVSGAGIGF
jgi:hypothetical protein